MTKENVLFSIIGVLLGFIVGFIFANSVNQRGPSTSVPAVTAGVGADGLPQNHPQLPVNAVKEQPPGMQAAVDDAAKQAKAAPNSFDAQMRAASGFAQINRYDEALDYLLRANELRPDDYEVVVQLGNANFEMGRFEAAERWYAAALVKQPEDVNVRTDLGLTFYFRKPNDIERAIQEFRRSLQYDPRHELTLQNITAVLTDKGDMSEAQTTLARLEQVNPTNPAIRKLREGIEASGGRARSAPGGTANPAR
ncbi:MAG: tetratricopeptide repeat protein [Acidobacteriota bacterium]|nr:tetratricopeptide repeat protein [Acidobacteriota bacterium]